MYVCVQIVVFFLFFSAVDEGEVGWEFFRMFNKFIHVGIFFNVLYYRSLMVVVFCVCVCWGGGGGGGGGVHNICGH